MHTTNNPAFPGAICALVIIALILLGCGRFGGTRDNVKNLTIPTIDPKEPFPALNADGIDALIADVPELAKHREGVMAAERDAIKGALDDLRSKSKASKGPRTAVEIAPGMAERRDSRTVGLFSGPFNLIPVAMAAEPDMSGLGSVQQHLIGHQIGFFMTDEGRANPSSGTGSKTATMKDEKTGEVQATATVSIETAGGVYTTEITTKVSMPVFGLDANSKVSLKGDPCPDSSGKVDLIVRSASNARAGRAGSVFYDKNIEARIVATVGDDAELASTDIDLRQAIHSTTGGQGIDIITSQSVQVPGGEYGNSKFGELKIIKQTGPDEDRSAKARDQAFMLATGVLESAKERWQGGGCVKIEANSPGTVQPSSTTSIPVTVRHKWDGSEVSSKLDAVLSGGNSVDPKTLAKTSGTLTYTAPGETDKRATIGLTANSRRGRAKLDLNANTGSNAYRVNGVSNNVTFDGQICSLSKPFTIDAKFPGGTATTTFAPGGTTTVSGGGGGCQHSGGGNYTVTLNEDGSGTLTWTTNDKIACPGFSNSRTATFTLPLAPAPDLSCP